MGGCALIWKYIPKPRQVEFSANSLSHSRSDQVDTKGW